MVSLHEIDVINSRSQGFLALFAGDTGESTIRVVVQSGCERVSAHVHARASACIPRSRTALPPLLPSLTIPVPCQHIPPARPWLHLL